MTELPTSISLPLCRYDSHTCGACCWGEAVGRHTLVTQFRRQTSMFRQRFLRGRLPRRWPLLLHEVEARRGLDLVLLCLLLIPGLGDWLKPRLGRWLICAFLGFEDATEQRIGCMLHPTRWNDRDIRPETAFALLPGFACGSPDYYCLSAHWFRGATWKEKKALSENVACMDWYQFSRLASTYRPQRKGACAAHLPAGS